jgi:hypothetical protein
LIFGINCWSAKIEKILREKKSGIISEKDFESLEDKDV